jgi:hypothetical protein
MIFGIEKHLLLRLHNYKEKGIACQETRAFLVLHRSILVEVFARFVLDDQKIFGIPFLGCPANHC